MLNTYIMIATRQGDNNERKILMFFDSLSYEKAEMKFQMMGYTVRYRVVPASNGMVVDDILHKSEILEAEA